MTEFDIANENVIVAKTKANEIVTEEYINMLTQFQELQAQIKVKDAEIKEALLKAMTETNTWVIDNDRFKISRIEPKDKTVVDTQKMKDEGIYDLFTKKTKVNPYIKFELKYEE